MNTCAYCGPLPEEPLNEGHVAVRWGQRRFVILLNGEDVSNACPEAMGGRDGWVILYSRPKKVLCPNGLDHAWAEKVFGDVQVLSRNE